MTTLYKELKNSRKRLQENSMLLADVRNSLSIEVAKQDLERISTLTTIKNSLISENAKLNNNIEKLSVNYSNNLSLQ